MGDAQPANAALLPYQLSSNAPAIVLPDRLGFQQERGGNAVNYLDGRLKELQAEYEQLYRLAQDTVLVYNARYNFVPKVGQMYYLYGGDQDCFLSLISPDQWTRTDYRGAFRFTTDNVWERIND